MTRGVQPPRLEMSSKWPRGLVATVAAAFAAPAVGMLAILIGSLVTGAPLKPGHLVAMVGITLFWAPAIAFIPAALIGLLVERPKSREMIVRGRGGLAVHLLTSALAGAVLALLFRLLLRLFDPAKPILDPPILGFFTLIGLCSGIAWWVLVVVPGRRA